MLNHECVLFAHSGWFILLSYNPSCRLASRRGRIYLNNLERARLYPTGRHWVDNLITPSLLAHQLLRFQRKGDWRLPQLCIKRLLLYFLSLDTTTMQGPSRGTASRCQCSCLPRPRTTLPPVHLSADTRQAAGTLSLLISSESRRHYRSGNVGLKSITLSSKQVSEWIDSFPISAYVSDTLDHCYYPDLSSSSTKTPHKEEGVKRCKVDEDNNNNNNIYFI